MDEDDIYQQPSSLSQMREDLFDQLVSYRQSLKDRESTSGHNDAYGLKSSDEEFPTTINLTDVSQLPYVSPKGLRAVALHVPRNENERFSLTLAWIDIAKFWRSSLHIDDIILMDLPLPDEIESYTQWSGCCFCTMDTWVPMKLFTRLCKLGYYGTTPIKWSRHEPFPSDTGVYEVQACNNRPKVQQLNDAIELSHEKVDTVNFALPAANDLPSMLTNSSLTELPMPHLSELKQLAHYWISFADSSNLPVGLLPPDFISIEVEHRGDKARLYSVANSPEYPRLISSTALVLHHKRHLSPHKLIHALLNAGCAQEHAQPHIPSTLLNGGQWILYHIGSVPNHKVPDDVYIRAYVESAFHLQPQVPPSMSDRFVDYGNRGIGQSPMSDFSSPASFMTRSSPASFMTARSAYTSPALGTVDGLSPATRITTIREDEPPDPGLSTPLQQIHKDYYQTLRQQDIIQPFDKELNWSGKGQHVTFTPQETIPLTKLLHLGSSMTATVDAVLCRRIALARKTMRCSRQWTVADALREVYHLQNLRHRHIIQLVGTYLQGRSFSILMYPVADCHLGTFLEDTSDLTHEDNQERGLRGLFLPTTLSCLSSAVAWIHKSTTKHMDIKPQNILVRALEEGNWRIYLADFGLSRNFASQGHSQTDGPTSRTPRYCAPEVYNHEQRGRSADIFSLGCVFLEILTVYAFESLEEFADKRRGDGKDESFHANLNRVADWIFRLREAGQGWFRGEAVIPTNVLDMVAQMIHIEPSQRPSASNLLELFDKRDWSRRHCSFSSQACCSQLPEKYEIFRAKS